MYGTASSSLTCILHAELDISEMMRRLEDFYVRGYYRALLWDISIFPYIALLTGEVRSRLPFGAVINLPRAVGVCQPPPSLAGPAHRNRGPL